MTETETQAVKVVVVGGSFAGQRAYNTLIRASRRENLNLDVTLVDSRGFWEYTPGILRCLVEPKHAKNMIFCDSEEGDGRQHKNVTALACGILIAPPPSPGTAADDSSRAHRGSTPAPAERGQGDMRVVATAVTLSGGHPPLPFDYCILATGSRYVSPIKPAMSMHGCGGHDNDSQAAPVDPSDAPAATAMLAPRPDIALGAGDATTRRRHLLESRMAELEDAHRTLQRCRSVAIIGGGTVGVELAAEIVGRWGPAKAVTLITSHDRLLERMGPSASKHALTWLERRGVRVWTGDRVTECRPSSPAHVGSSRAVDRDGFGSIRHDDNHQGVVGSGRKDGRLGNAAGGLGGKERDHDTAADDATRALLASNGDKSSGRGGGEEGMSGAEQAGYTLETSSGRHLDVDVVYRCVGFAPNGGVAGDIPGAVDSRGFLRVDRHLRVQATANVFAAGDCIDIPDEKTALTAELSGTLAARNVLRCLAARREGGSAALLTFPQVRPSLHLRCQSHLNATIHAHVRCLNMDDVLCVMRHMRRLAFYSADATRTVQRSASHIQCRRYLDSTAVSLSHTVQALLGQYSGQPLTYSAGATWTVQRSASHIQCRRYLDSTAVSLSHTVQALLGQYSGQPLTLHGVR
eukprot:jgi/Mesvir1/25469/Mv01733-RA.2